MLAVTCQEVEMMHRLPECAVRHPDESKDNAPQDFERMTLTNPYEPPAVVHLSEDQPLPHGRSMRAEAWRGATLGVKFSAIVTAAIFVIIAIVMAGLFVYAVIATEGDVLRNANMIEVAKSIGYALAAIAAIAFLGGITGAFIMATAACLRKRHSVR
jgi:hypothetical protein